MHSIGEVILQRDPPPKNFLSPKSHILDSNGVWYSSFWLEGPKNHLNLKILVLKFFPRDLKGQRILDFQGRRSGTLRGSTFLLFSSIFLPPPHINNVHNSKLKNLKYYAGRKLKKTIFRPLQPKQATQLLQNM